MTTRPLIRTTLASLLATVAGSAAWAAASAVPPALVPAAHEALTLSVSARGVQIYECRRAGDGAAWAFVAPEAELFDAEGRPVGTHGAGPHWRFADGSHLTARLKARTDAPRPDAIPWLLLDALAVRPGDRLARVSSIQRINTRGGQAPAAGCTHGRIGRAVRVPYSADYLFYGRR